jgi:hypothetical protein
MERMIAVSSSIFVDVHTQLHPAGAIRGPLLVAGA